MLNKLIDGKKIIVKGNSKNIPPFKTIKGIYAKIPDNKRIPVVFETREQYLDEYIKNQEKAKRIKFTEPQIASYKHKELSNMQNIVSRYTTDHNPYIDRRVVFFNDQKIPKRQFTESVLHEYGHEIWEKNPKIRKDWKSVSKNSSPTAYGRTAKQEDFAESYMLSQNGRLQDPKRSSIIARDISKSRMIRDNKSYNDNQIYLSGKSLPIKRGTNKRYGFTREGMNNYISSESTGAFVMPAIFNKATFIGRGMTNIDFDKPKNINYLGNILEHEEIHTILQEHETPKKGVSKASRAYDNIVIPTVNEPGNRGNIINPYSAQMPSPKAIKGLTNTDYDTDLPIILRNEKEYTPTTDTTSRQSIKDELGGSYLPEEVTFSTQWKAFGMPKKYYPNEVDNLKEKVLVTTQDRAVTKENVGMIAGLMGIRIPSFRQMIMTDRTALSKKIVLTDDISLQSLFVRDLNTKSGIERYNSPYQTLNINRGQGISANNYPSVDEIGYFYDTAPTLFAKSIPKINIVPKSRIIGGAGDAWAHVTYTPGDAKSVEMNIFPLKRFMRQDYKNVPQILVHETGHGIGALALTPVDELNDRFATQFNTINAPTMYPRKVLAKKLRKAERYNDPWWKKAAEKSGHHEDFAESIAVTYPLGSYSKPNPLSTGETLNARKEFFKSHLGADWTRGRTPRMEYEESVSPEEYISEGLSATPILKTDEEYQKDYEGTNKQFLRVPEDQLTYSQLQAQNLQIAQERAQEHRKTPIDFGLSRIF